MLRQIYDLLLPTFAFQTFLSIFICLALTHRTFASRGVQTPSVFLSKSDHQEKILSLARKVSQRSVGSQVVLKRNQAQGHCPRPQAYKSTSLQLDISELTNVLSIEKVDSEDLPSELNRFAHEIVAVADVQALISMEQLVDFLLPNNMIPAVVPEFKGITVGGSVQGLAAESTSFKYGLLHDAIVGFEAILGDGNVVWCSAKSNADLFYGLPGTFGTIAIITRVKIYCLKAKPMVRLTCISHSSCQECVDYMGRLQDDSLLSPLGSGSQIDFLEGLGFSDSEVLSVEGLFCDSNTAKDIPIDNKASFIKCNLWGWKWFFNQVKDISRKHPREKTTIIIPTKDYLFRHDHGSFWMASYRIPQIIGRFMGSLLDSTSMFRLATALPWAFPKHQIILQDFMLPRSNVVQFFKYLQSLLTVWPIWLLPMRNIKQSGSIFASSDVPGHFCNVGAYGIPKNTKYNFEMDNKLLEASLFENNGRKVYYSHAYYDRDFFYNKLHDGKRYFDLRDKFNANKAFPDVYDKVITKNGKL